MAKVRSRSAVIGVGLKTYLSHEETLAWCDRVVRDVGDHDAIRSGTVTLFVLPTFPQLVPVRDALQAITAAVGSQDVSAFGPGAYTGEVTAEELREIGMRFAQIGHIERRRLFGDSHEVIAAKATAALRNDLTPVLCVGEPERSAPLDAAATVVNQIHRDLEHVPAGRVVIAYEPVWSIGAKTPAPADHIATVASAIRDALDADSGREGSAIIYGGSARPGVLPQVGTSLDGLILGRVAHDTENLIRVIDEAAAQAR